MSDERIPAEQAIADPVRNDEVTSLENFSLPPGCIEHPLPTADMERSPVWKHPQYVRFLNKSAALGQLARGCSVGGCRAYSPTVAVREERDS
ncbi:MAG: hypothetical protein K8U57_01705 [Planctomycetes bacterium]|nr:hypothetical protein [Planctomycetota bacterium]